MRADKIKRLLGGLGALGYTVSVREQEHEDSAQLGHDQYLVMRYAALNALEAEEFIENLGFETETEFVASIVDVLTNDYCPDHAVEALARGDLSQLSTATARAHEAHETNAQ